MVKIVKKGDTYKPEKLKASIIKAGASESIAKQVVDSMKVKDGMTTLDLRKQVSAQLRKLDTKAADKYDSFGKAIKLVKKGDTYKPEKLKASIIKAGASESIANQIANSLKLYSGMSTKELKEQVVAKLRGLDANAARAYESFKK